MNYHGLTVHRTRFPELGYVKIDNACWQFIDLNQPDRMAQVGPHYKTKVELLADLERYARESWGLA